MAVAQRIENTECEPYLGNHRGYSPDRIHEVERRFEEWAIGIFIAVLWIGFLAAVIRLLQALMCG